MTREMLVHAPEASRNIATGEGDRSRGFITRFPSLYAFLVGERPARKTPPGQRRGSSPSWASSEEDDDIMAVNTLERKGVTLLPLGKAPPATEAQQIAEWVRRGSDEVFTVTALLTPSMAALLLERNEGNRPVLMGGTNRSVAGYAGAMKRGEWVVNGKSLVVSRCGKLNDGQHRCMAVVHAQVAIPVQITFGVERETRHTVDQGIARTPGHILAMRGEANANQLAGTLQFLWALDERASLHNRPSPDQLCATLDRHPEARTATSATSKLFSHYRLSPGYIAGAHYRCRQHGSFSADQFLQALTTGLNIQNTNSPVARLRKQFEEHSANRKPLDRIEQAALYIKGYNNFIRGRSGPIVWRNTGPAAEGFPAVGG